MDYPTFSTEWQEKAYVTPSCRVVKSAFEQSFLQSNLEPIGGGDDPEIDW